MCAFFINSMLLLFRYASEKSTPNKSQAANEQSPMVARSTFTFLILASSNTELFMFADVNSAPSKLAPSNDERYILLMIASRFFILALQKEQFKISAARMHALFIVAAIKLHPVILALMKSVLFKQELSNKTLESVLECSLKCADFCRAKLDDVKFVKCDMREAIFDEAELEGVEFKESDLSELSAKYIVLRGRVPSTVNNCNYEGMTLTTNQMQFFFYDEHEATKIWPEGLK